MTIGSAIWKIFRVCFWLAVILVLVIGNPDGFWEWAGVVGGFIALIDVLEEKQ